MKNKKNPHLPSSEFKEDYDYLSTSSATDCTGSVPRAIENEEELESYLDVYPFLPRIDGKK